MHQNPVGHWRFWTVTHPSVHQEKRVFNIYLWINQYGKWWEGNHLLTVGFHRDRKEWASMKKRWLGKFVHGALYRVQESIKNPLHTCFSTSVTIQALICKIYLNVFFFSMGQAAWRMVGKWPWLFQYFTGTETYHQLTVISLAFFMDKILHSVLPYEHLHGDHSIHYLPQGFLLDFWTLERTTCTNFPSLLFYVLAPSCPCGNLLSTHVDFPATSYGGWLTEKVEKSFAWWNLRWVAAQKYHLLMGIWCQATVPADIDVAPIPTLPLFHYF